MVQNLCDLGETVDLGKDKLVVGVDCWALRLNGGGARFVFESLLEHFRYSKHTFILFLHPEAYECIEEVQLRTGILRNCTRVKINSPSQILIYKQYIDVFYCPFNNISVRFLDKPIVSVLHDIQECFLPQLFSYETLNGRQEDYSDILRCSTRIITISEFCKQSFVKHYHADPRKIQVVHNAAQEAIVYYSKHQGANKSLKAILRLSDEKYIGKYAIYPANFYPHKNHSKLLEAYKLASHHNIYLPDLILVGKSWGGKDCPTELIERFGLTGQIHVVSDLQPEELAYLYKNCEFVVLPTLFEGFCLPAVEALTFGKILVCSNLEILREITNGQAIYFDPEKEDSILSGLHQAIELADEESSDPDLGTINSKNRVSIASQYSWDKSASSTLEIIEQAYHSYEFCHSEYGAKWLFHVVYHGEPIQWLTDTIDSVLNQVREFDSLKIVITNFSNNVFLDNYLRDLYSFEFEVFSGFQTSPSYLAKYLMPNMLFLNIFAGNILCKSLFKNVKRKIFENPRLELILGEVIQVHEDEERTFEKYNYFRVVDNKLVLNGALYAEMLIQRNPNLELFDKSWHDLWNPEKILLSFHRPLMEVLERFTVAQVRFRSVLHLKQEEDVNYGIEYDPDKSHTLLNREQALKHQEFLGFVNTKLAETLHCQKPTMTTEISKVLDGDF